MTQNRGEDKSRTRSVGYPSRIQFLAMMDLSRRMLHAGSKLEKARRKGSRAIKIGERIVAAQVLRIDGTG